jgi:hypothetical protein
MEQFPPHPIPQKWREKRIQEKQMKRRSHLRLQMTAEINFFSLPIPTPSLSKPLEAAKNT